MLQRLISAYTLTIVLLGVMEGGGLGAVNADPWRGERRPAGKGRSRPGRMMETSPLRLQVHPSDVLHWPGSS